MKRVLLLFTMVLALAGLTSAETKTVTFDFKNNDYGLERSSSTYIANGTKVQSGDVTLSLNKTGSNGWRLWSDGLRVYKNSGVSMVVAVPNAEIKSVAFTMAKTGIITAYTVNSGTSISVSETEFTAACSGSEANLGFTVGANGAIAKAVITYETAGAPLTPVNLAFAQETLELVVDDMVEAPELSGVPEGVEVTYTSSKPDVAALEDGIVYAYTVGEAIITASTAANETYAAGEATLKVVVTAAPDLRQEAGLSFGDVTEFTTYVEAEDFEAPTLTKATNAAIVYTSSNEDVVYVDENSGDVLIGAAGTAVITATAAENDEYKAGTASYTIIVKKIDAALAYSEAAVEKYLNSTEHGEFPALTNEAAIEVVYDSSNKDVATVDAEGAVTILAAGNTTISAVPANTAKYEGAASYVLTVTDASIVAGGYVQLTDMADLTDGIKGLIVCKNQKQAAGALSGGFLPGVLVTVTDNTIADAGDALVITFVAGTNDGEYALKISETEYLVWDSSTKMKASTTAEYYPISLTTQKNAVVRIHTKTGSEANRDIQWVSSQSGSFRAYASDSQTSVQIFIESAGQGVEAPSVEVVFEEVADGEYLADFIYDSENGVVVYYNVTNESPAFRAVSKDGLEVTKHTEKVPVVDGDLLTYYAENKGVQSETKQIPINKQTTGVENISVDAAAPAEFFDLQGRPVANPANGIFIRRAGSTVTKVAL